MSVGQGICFLESVTTRSWGTRERLLAGPVFKNAPPAVAPCSEFDVRFIGGGKRIDQESVSRFKAARHAPLRNFITPLAEHGHFVKVISSMIAYTRRHPHTPPCRDSHTTQPFLQPPQHTPHFPFLRRAVPACLLQAQPTTPLGLAVVRSYDPTQRGSRGDVPTQRERACKKSVGR